MAGIGLGSAVADMIINDGPIAPIATEYSTYTVVAGDSLSSIAQKVLGDPSRWKEIFNINPDIQDPNVLNIGQVLNIPAGAVASSTDPNKTTLPGPVHTAIVPTIMNASGGAAPADASADSSSTSFLNSPGFILGAAGLALLIIMMAGKKKAA